MYKRILVPTDFSQASFAAFKPAEELAVKFKASLYLLHVAEDVPVYAYHIGISQKELKERVVEHAAGGMRKAAKRLRKKRAELLIRSGNVQDEILHTISSRNIDLVVMGTHGRGFAKALVGSVTERIVRNARCHVLTVKSK